MKNNFILTITFAILFSLIGVVYIFFFLPPSDLLLIILLMLVGFIVNAVFALVYYRFATQRPFESEKEVFRRCYKKGIILGLLVVILLAVQVQFDLI